LIALMFALIVPSLARWNISEFGSPQEAGFILPS
jgi:hypothetical protein